MNSNIRQFSLNIIASLIPAISCAIYFFGLEAVRIISLCVITSILCEVGVNIATRTRLTIGNCSAILTGLLLALCLPPKTPSFTAILGSIFAILIVKMPFKKFGKLIFNPVLAARSFLLLFCTSSLVTWTPSSWNVSAGDIETITTATPLTHLKFNLANLDWSTFDIVGDLFFGNINGSLGETSSLALIAGGLILFITRTISPLIPLSYILTVALFSFLTASVSPIIEVLSGGLLLGAIFLASDPATSPSSSRGKIIFGFGCGILTMLIRKLPNSGFPEGVAFAILIMNAITPLIDSLTFCALYRNKV